MSHVDEGQFEYSAISRNRLFRTISISTPNASHEEAAAAKKGPEWERLIFVREALCGPDAIIGWPDG